MIAALLGLLVAALPLVWVGRARAVQEPSTGSIGGHVSVIALGSIAAMVFSPPIVLIGLLLGFAAKPVSTKARSMRMERARVAAMPDGLELIAMAISAGMSISAMLSFAARCGPPPIRPLFVSAERSLAVGRSRKEVLYQLAREGGANLMPACEILIAADRDGAPVALVLDRLAVEAGRARQLAVEERARRAPVLMLAPLTLCSLPAVLFGTVLPFVLLSFGQTSL